MTKFKKQLFLTAACVLTLSFCACAKPDQGFMTSSPETYPGEEVITVQKSGLIEEYTYEDLIQEAPVIVVGQVVGFSDPFQIIPVYGGDPSIFTDVSFQVDHVLRGEGSLGKVLNIRKEGGQINGLQVIVEESPDLELGHSYLLFLYQPKMGGGFNTLGDYYYVLGMEQGVFPLTRDEELNPHQLESLELNNGLGVETSLHEMEKDLNTLSPSQKSHAENENKVKESFLANQEANLASGFITQEEYDRLLKESQVYAEIIR